jgi:hypothetical protein
VNATPPERPATPAEQAIRAWALSGSTTRQLAALLGRELLGKPPGTPVDSSMKIAARFRVNNSTAVRARRFLTGAKIIRQSRADRHYYVA